ncbi:MAG: tRNA sulfurtransferase [Candidatus Aenigmatarchaeota archaeon]
MDMNWILIRYGEIGLKSDYVRRSFEDRLINNIRQGLEERGINGKVQRGYYGRIFISTEEVEKASEVLERTFGVVSFSPCKKISTELEEITDELSRLGQEVLQEGESFAVRARRTGDHSFSSKDVEERAGSKILESKNVEVDLDDPDKKVMADIRQGQSYIFNEKRKGPGGLPIGTQGKVLSLFRGGCSSLLATWMMMKRGCSVTILHGKMEPYSDDENFERSFEVLKNWNHGSSLEVLEFDLGSKIFQFSEEGEKGYNCALCRRFLHRLASKVTEETGCKAIVTGDYINGRFDQFHLYDAVTRTPIIRPLVGMDKEEINKRCGEIAPDTEFRGSCEAKDKGISEVKQERLEELEKKIDIEKLVEEVGKEVVED